MRCQGTVKSYVNGYVARLNHSNAKYFKAQAIKHNREKFITANKEGDVQMVRTTILENCMGDLHAPAACEN